MAGRFGRVMSDLDYLSLLHGVTCLWLCSARTLGTGACLPRKVIPGTLGLIATITAARASEVYSARAPVKFIYDHMRLNIYGSKCAGASDP